MAEKTLTEMLRVRITKDQREQLEEFAEQDQRSVGAVVRRAVHELLDRERQEAAA